MNAMSEEVINVKIVDLKALDLDRSLNTEFRFLFWACCRDYLFVAYHVISKTGISPFFSVDDQSCSPFMMAIDDNSVSVVKMLLAKTWRYNESPGLIAKQMLNLDTNGNNALHKACHTRNPEMIKILLSKKIWDLK